MSAVKYFSAPNYLLMLLSIESAPAVFPHCDEARHIEFFSTEAPVTVIYYSSRCDGCSLFFTIIIEGAI